MARERLDLLEMGQRIARLRRDHGFSQQYIADYVGVRLRTYQFWQQGKSPPEQENLEKLAELFGVTPKYILKGETPELLVQREDQLDRIEAEVTAIRKALEAGLNEASARDLAIGEQLDEVLRLVSAPRRQRRAG